MPNNYKGLNISGLKSTTKLSRIQVQPTIDFVVLTDRGLLNEPIAKLRTAGAGHRKSPNANANARAKSTVSETIDMGGLWEPASNYDYGEVEEDAFVISENSRWSARRKLMNPPVVTVDWSNATLAYTLDNPNAYDTSANDFFGCALEIDGDFAIVGAYGEDDAADVGVYGSGKAYIFNATTGALVHTLDNPNPYGDTGYDSFGRSVAISGDYAIVGAIGEDHSGGGTNGAGDNAGKAYIFNVTSGLLVHTLNNPNPYTPTSQNGGDRFGWVVAISGDYAIVSAHRESDQSGKAYIYNVTTGALVHTLDNPNPYSGTYQDEFGYSAAISGDYAIVGAYAEDDADGTSSGKAYIFNVTSGLLVHTLDNPNPFGTSTDDYFGRSVAISGDHAIVGAVREDDPVQSAGKAYIYNVTSGLLVHTLDNPSAYSSPASDLFGDSVAISGDYAIVGAFGEGDADATWGSGKAYIFNVTTGLPVYTLDNPNPYGTSSDDRFSWGMEGNRGVSISGGRAMVGARQEDDLGGTNSGKAYIFQVV